MAYLRPLCRDDGGILRPVSGADVLSRGSAVFNSANAASVIYTAAAIVAGFVVRTLNGAVSDTTDTAVNIMQGLYGNTSGGMEVGETVQLVVSNQGSGAITLIGGTGVTMQGLTTVAVGATRFVLITCTNKGTQIFNNGVYTNTGATFTAMGL